MTLAVGLRQPVAVAFIASLSELLRVIQANRLDLGTALQRAAYALVSDVFLRQDTDERVSRHLAAASGLAEPRQVEPEVEIVEDGGSRSPQPRTGRTEDAVLDVLESVVDGILTGRSLERQRGQISRYISNQEARAELIANLVQTDDYRRLVRLLRARGKLEQSLLSAMERHDLNPSEMLALHQVASHEVAVTSKGVLANANNVNDVIGLLEKADAAFSDQEEFLAKKFAKTTPQGREVIRRLAHRLSKLNKKP